MPEYGLSRKRSNWEREHTYSQKDGRCYCDVCQQTFTTTKGTIFYRLRSDPMIVMYVVVLLAYGCPVQAIVKAFGLDERTVSDWHERAGKHCQRVHEHMVENSQQDLQQVQADEIKVKTQKGTYWMALAMAEGILTIDRRIVQGTQEMVKRLIGITQQAKGVINTAFIERLNATFRQRLNNLVRRTRTLARRPETLTAGMYLVGCFYNFCDFHHGLRLKLSVGNYGHRWVQRTPAIAAGLTDHQWTPAELFASKVPLPRWKPPAQRGRPSLALLQLSQRWAA